MNVILLEKLANLGEIGDVVKVKAGYARNYLLPQGKAHLATPENLKLIEENAHQLQQKAQQQLEQAQALAEQLQQTRVVIKAAASEEGKLFGSIGNRDIAAALNERGVGVERRQINLDDGPLRNLGEHWVRAVLHADVQLKFSITIEAE